MGVRLLMIDKKEKTNVIVEWTKVYYRYSDIINK